MLSLGKSCYKALKKHFLRNGLTSRVHGNTKRPPANTLSQQDTENALHFIQMYARANAILLPGRIPGYKRFDLQLLPSCTKKKVCA